MTSSFGSENPYLRDFLLLDEDSLFRFDDFCTSLGSQDGRSSYEVKFYPMT